MLSSSVSNGIALYGGQDGKLIWPGVGFAPAQPRPGAHAEVQFPGVKKHGHGLFGPTARKKTVAYVIITGPSGPVTRTVTGDFRIRQVMAWCSEFNRISETMGAEVRRPPNDVRSSDDAVERDPEVQCRLLAHRALMTNPHGEPAEEWAKHMKESLQALWDAREAARSRLGNNDEAHTTEHLEQPTPELQRPQKELTSELERLAALHESGALDDEEFRAAKARVIGGTTG